MINGEWKKKAQRRIRGTTLAEHSLPWSSQGGKQVLHVSCDAEARVLAAERCWSHQASTAARGGPEARTAWPRTRASRPWPRTPGSSSSGTLSQNRRCAPRIDWRSSRSKFCVHNKREHQFNALPRFHRASPQQTHEIPIIRIVLSGSEDWRPASL